VDAGEFEDQVQQAIDSLPADLAARLDNVDVAVVDWPAPGQHLYGLYTGIPLTRRSSAYAGALPDRIEIYRGPIMRDYGHDAQRLAHQIRVTTLHEIGHYFGMSESRLRELGWG
jgi:predicted Zn-dependent protease with MMP-like domain